MLGLFPSEILSYIVNYLPLKSSIKLRQVSKEYCNWFDNDYQLEVINYDILIPDELILRYAKSIHTIISQTYYTIDMELFSEICKIKEKNGVPFECVGINCMKLSLDEIKLFSKINNNRIKILKLFNGDKIINELLNHFNCGIEDLYIQGPHISEDKINKLTSSSTIYKLKKLSAYATKLSSQTIEKVARTANEIKLSSSYVEGSSFKYFSNLKVLHSRFVNINDDNLKWLKNIESFRTTNKTKITDKGLFYLSATKLNEISIISNEITDAGLKYFSNHDAQIVEFSSNKITNVGLSYLLIHGRKKINLYNAKINDEGLKCVRDLDNFTCMSEDITDTGLSYLCDVKHLVIKGKKITDKGLKLLNRKKKLKYLVLHNCSHITINGLKYLKGIKSLILFGNTDIKIKEARKILPNAQLMGMSL